MTKGQEIAYKWNSTGAWERQAEAIDAAIAEAVRKKTRELDDDRGLLEDSIASAIAGSLARTGLTNEPHGTLEGYLRTLEKHIAEAKRKTRQEFADVLRDAKCRCHELVNLHNGIHCEDVKQTIKDIDSILALSIPPVRPAESRSLNRGC